jgi:hypothetical protein
VLKGDGSLPPTSPMIVRIEPNVAPLKNPICGPRRPRECALVLLLLGGASSVAGTEPTGEANISQVKELLPAKTSAGDGGVAFVG